MIRNFSRALAFSTKPSLFVNSTRSITFRQKKVGATKFETPVSKQEVSEELKETPQASIDASAVPQTPIDASPISEQASNPQNEPESDVWKPIRKPKKPEGFWKTRVPFAKPTPDQAVLIKKYRLELEEYNRIKHTDWVDMGKGNKLDLDVKEAILQDQDDQQIKNATRGKGPQVLLGLVGLGFLYMIYVFGWTTMTDYDNSRKPMSILKRAEYYFFEYIQSFVKPIGEPLLDKLEPPAPGYIDMRPKYTFVFEPIGLLIIQDPLESNGWRQRKRPGCKQLLNACMMSLDSPKNQLDCTGVLWTTGQDFDNMEAMEALCEGRMSSLYRSACYYKMKSKTLRFVVVEILLTFNKLPAASGLQKQRIFLTTLPTDFFTSGLNSHYEKNLEKLGRDMRTTILFDTNPEIVKAYPRNALLMKPIDPEQKYDTTLFDVLNLLNMLNEDGINDVRPIVEYYHQFGENWIDEFRRRQALEKQAQEKQQQPQKAPPSARSRFMKKLF